jgi:hypothetical protein
MLIRSTPHACFVILRNGLTLELFYDEVLTGARSDGAHAHDTDRPSPSQGVWLMGESVVSEVRAGQA